MADREKSRPMKPHTPGDGTQRIDLPDADPFTSDDLKWSWEDGWPPAKPSLDAPPPEKPDTATPTEPE